MLFYVARLRIRGTDAWTQPMSLFARDLGSAVARLNYGDYDGLDIRQRASAEARLVFERDDQDEGVLMHPKIDWRADW